MTSRVIYAEDENLSLSYEVLNDCLYVHVVLHAFNKHVFERLRAAWEHMKMDAYMDGWEYIFTYTKDPRIVSLIGGAEEIVSDELPKGIKVFKWELK